MAVTSVMWQYVYLKLTRLVFAS